MLEGSGKWPDNVDAIRRLKAAYSLSLSQALGKIAPSVLSAAYADYLEVYKVCSEISMLFVKFVVKFDVFYSDEFRGICREVERLFLAHCHLEACGDANT